MRRLRCSQTSHLPSRQNHLLKGDHPRLSQSNVTNTAAEPQPETLGADVQNAVVSQVAIDVQEARLFTMAY